MRELEQDAEAFGGLAELEVDEVPAELGRRVLFADSRSHLTLRNARIIAPGQRGVTPVPVMRVQLAQVAAWWILQIDERGEGRFALWRDDDPGVTVG